MAVKPRTKKKAPSATVAAAAEAPARSFEDELEIVLGRLARRSDVTFDAFTRMGRHPFGAWEKVMPSDLVALCKSVGATYVAWRFVDDAPEVQRGRFGMRQPSSEGWWVPGIAGRPAMVQKQALQLASKDPINPKDEKGRPWPESTRCAQLFGGRDAGVLWRVDEDGTSSYARFDEKGITRALGSDVIALFRDQLARSFAGDFGKPDAAVASRLEKEAAPRPAFELEILENRPIAWDEYRALRLGAHWPDQLPKLGAIFGIPGLEKLPLLERGKALLEAVAAPSIPAGKMEAAMKLVTGSKKTKKDFDLWRNVKELEPMAFLRIAARLAAGADPEHVKMEDVMARSHALKFLIDVPGFEPVGYDADVIRFGRREDPSTGLAQIGQFAGWTGAPKAVLDETRDGNRFEASLALPAAWVRSIAAPAKHASAAFVLGERRRI